MAATDVPDVPRELQIALLILAGVLFVSTAMMCKPNSILSETSNQNIKRELSVALRSGCIYFAIAMPFIWSDAFSSFPSHFRTNYLWLPFWYAFVVTPYLGNTYDVAVQSIRGTLWSMFAAVLLNYIIPGGVAAEAPHAGFRSVFAFMYTVIFVYCVFVSSCNVGTKQYALGIWSGIIVAFMNPSLEENEFRAVLLDWQFQINWTGSLLCQVYVVCLAVLLSVLTLPLNPFKQDSIDFYSCKSQVTSLLAELANDTVGALERLIKHYREGTSKYALESSYLYIRELGARRSAIEKLMDGARWECYGCAMKKHHETLRRFSLMLRGFRQVLRIQLEYLRAQHERATPLHSTDISLQLDGFLVSLRDAMHAMADQCHLKYGLDDLTRQHLSDTASAGDAMLVLALSHLQVGHSSHVGHSSLPMEMAFVDGLRTCSELIRNFITEPHVEPTEVSLMSWLRTMAPWHPRPSWEQHVYACRHSISWLLAFLWSAYVRGYRSATVSTVSFLFSSGLGSLFHKNINRMVGVGMGLVMANLPAELLLRIDAGGDKFGSFKLPRQGLVLYLVTMLLMWTLAMYGYLATGAKWSYACLLWAGFGGCQMLSHLQVLVPSGGEGDSRSMLFRDMIDNFTGIFIVFVIDVFFALLLGGTTAERVATLAPQCLHDISFLIEQFWKGEIERQRTDISVLQKRIADCRFWDLEVQKEDLIWTAMEGRYRMDFVHALLDQCDDAYVAAYAIQACMDRIGAEASLAIATLKDTFPENLGARARWYGRAVATALHSDAVGHVPHITVSLDEAVDWQPMLSLLSSLPTRQTSWHEDVTISGALVTLRTSGFALRLALRRIDVLISEHAHWAFDEWRQTARMTEIGGASLFAVSRSGSRLVSSDSESDLHKALLDKAQQ